ncbi:hypothetical protein P691DRAFT_185694 [Macrolepiota fuliginosa MF-IS2]|uniref:Protein kinase domain-containing protein n=1 Tax=Macrolepiota fuliginosa MF-IS2 TaxID=1400762 RepID=A0A9P5X992_9AGAR|nr:hypothetical protein P691DRAFT_185694 [Macrolepiota fuliginosa MF-IS2]
MQEYRNGNILEYIDRVGASYLQRTRWLLHVATALQYLHGADIIHGNVHVNNILISDDGGARLADAAIYTTIIRHFVPSDILWKIRFPDSLSCKSAEEILAEESRPTPTLYRDIFALAVTIWTVYKGKEPFQMYDQTPQTVQQVGSYGHRNLGAVEGMSDGLWRLLSIVMKQETAPENAPSLGDIISELRELVN